MKTKIPSEHISKTSLIYQRYKINSPDSEIIFRNWTASRVSYWRKLHINRERHCKCFKDQTTIHLFKQKLKRCCFNYGVTLNKFRLAFKKTFPMKSNYNHWIDFPQANNQSYCDYYNYFWWNFSEKKKYLAWWLQKAYCLTAYSVYMKVIVCYHERTDENEKNAGKLLFRVYLFPYVTVIYNCNDS